MIETELIRHWQRRGMEFNLLSGLVTLLGVLFCVFCLVGWFFGFCLLSFFPVTQVVEAPQGISIWKYGKGKQCNVHDHKHLFSRRVWFPLHFLLPPFEQGYIYRQLPTNLFIASDDPDPNTAPLLFLAQCDDHLLLIGTHPLGPFPLLSCC